VRRLIVSDIHGNNEALEAVLEHAEDQYDEAICCGDLVGYGASPNEVIDWARNRCVAVVRGNHDRACSTLEGVREFNPVASAAAYWTHNRLSSRDLDWLANLPRGPLELDGYLLAHGSPNDEDEYLFHGEQALASMEFMTEPVCFVGHTHVQGGWSWERGGVMPLPRPGTQESERILSLSPEGLHLVNPGSVGQPRDGDPRAAYALWDSRERLLRLRRVSYNVRMAQERMLVEGLPEYLAARLSVGR
jgi:diadenosine tetraphosphatase ApaH/serine/threonine PP2A family protein phosphatase